MRKFILKSLVYLSVLIALHILAAQWADGTIDPYYQRFANGRHASMILGTSRAAQGLRPDVFAEVLGPGYAPVGNFSFTLGQSPYGPVYLERIKQKLNDQPTDQTRLFILSVDAWSISNLNNPDDDPARFREKDRLLAKVKNVVVDDGPNYLYLLKNYTDAWGSLFFAVKKNTEVHEDGWLEVNVRMDERSIEQRTRAKIRFYTENSLPFYTYSPTRYEYLQRTIDFLKAYGQVYLVRLPVHPQLLELEKKLIPDFREKMCALTQDRRISYWDLTPLSDQFIYTDGNHLHKESSKAVSRLIAERIKKGSTGDCSERATKTKK